MKPFATKKGLILFIENISLSTTDNKQRREKRVNNEPSHVIKISQ